MEGQSLEKLKKIIESREKRNNISGGEVFIVWGLLNIATALLFQLVYPHLLIWMAMISLGILFQIIFLRHTEKKEGSIVLWQRSIAQVWLLVVFSLPLIFFVFPHIFQIYSKTAIFPLINMVLAFGIFATAFMIQSLKPLFYFSGLVFLTASLLTAAFPHLFAYIYSFAMFLGFVVLGFLSKVLKKEKAE